ncbi:uncharacterized protein VTP21DRAFT_5214 [Calcarisporiella thermophila]|uniref:uncharacterized protein n=1 Tax=Calcarisporiella thermophila TaxID=911321 RepID=UPI003742AE91
MPCCALPPACARLPVGIRIMLFTLIPCIVVFILFFVTLFKMNTVNAAGPSIHQDIIQYLPNTTFVGADGLSPSKIYADGVMQVPNFPGPEKSGLSGILYEQTCNPSSDASNPARPKPRIALVGQGDCSILIQLTLARHSESASAAILYGEDDIIKTVAKSGGRIPVFYVPKVAGVELQETLRSQNNTDGRWVRVVLIPAVQSSAGIWELTLILVVVLLAISLMTSAALQCHMWRSRRRQAPFDDLLELAMNAQPRPKPKLTVPPEVLATFPVRSYCPPNAHLQVNSRPTSRRPSSASVNSNRSLRAIELATALDRRPSVASSVMSVDTCAVCIESYKPGDQIRRLLCQHEFHVECIDPWLTEKSATCPLCKYLCVSEDPSDQTEKPNPTPAADNTPATEADADDEAFTTERRPSAWRLWCGSSTRVDEDGDGVSTVGYVSPIGSPTSPTSPVSSHSQGALPPDLVVVDLEMGTSSEEGKDPEEGATQGDRAIAGEGAEESAPHEVAIPMGEDEGAIAEKAHSEKAPVESTQNVAVPAGETQVEDTPADLVQEELAVETLSEARETSTNDTLSTPSPKVTSAPVDDPCTEELNDEKTSR